MLNAIETHPLITALVGGAILGIAGHVLKKFFDPKPNSKSQKIQHSYIGGDVQQAGSIHNTTFITEKNTPKCTLRLKPIIDRIPPILNGGVFQGDFTNFQISFGSETCLELVSASLNCKGKLIGCEKRDSRLEAGKNWNSFLFPSSELPFVPDERIFLSLRVCDHEDNCCELIHELQMKQFSPPEHGGINSGRWELHPKGIFKIKNSNSYHT